MLRKIISITGKPGLFEILTQGNRMFIVEDVVTKKRFPALQRDKVVSLGDIAMYTESDDLALGIILDRLYENMKGEKIEDVKGLLSSGKIRDKFREIVPDFDEDRVYDTDIKKLFNWYNLLIEAGMTKFTADEDEKEETPAEDKKEEKKEEVPAEEKKKKAPAKKAASTTEKKAKAPAEKNEKAPAKKTAAKKTAETKTAAEKPKKTTTKK